MPRRTLANRKKRSSFLADQFFSANSKTWGVTRQLEMFQVFLCGRNTARAANAA